MRFICYHCHKAFDTHNAYRAHVDKLDRMPAWRNLTDAGRKEP